VEGGKKTEGGNGVTVGDELTMRFTEGGRSQQGSGGKGGFVSQVNTKK